MKNTNSTDFAQLVTGFLTDYLPLQRCYSKNTILTLLYDSGCRVQELCDLTIADIFPGANPTVRLHGKGDKYRTVVISEETSILINSYINRQLSSVLKNHPLITNRYHTRIDRDGISYILKKYATEIRKESPSFPEHVHCHMLRHYVESNIMESDYSKSA